jgi:hypothetical protein
MKKTLAILMMICLLAGALSITAFAANEPATGVVMTVSGLTKDGPVKIEDYTSFEAGWNSAMEKAKDSKYLDNNQYDRIVVDLLADWKANEKGVFGDDDGVGFPEYTIYIPEEARVMLNMNGHTIDRGLGDRNQFDGEVIYIDEKADVIINGGKSGDAIARADDTNATFGTITGGNNDGGAGGIYIQDDAKVTLNNVKIVNNVADGDYGAGIAVYDGATLIMNGGGFIDNKNNTSTHFDYNAYGAGVYIEDSTASFDNVLFEGNQFTYHMGNGAALYAYDSSVMMNKCKVVGNGKKNEADGTVGAISIITVEDSEMFIKETDFIGNGDVMEVHDGDICLIDVAMYIGTPQLSVDNCTFTQNKVGYIFDSVNQDVTVTRSRFTDNKANVLHCSSDTESIFTDCVLNNNIGMLSNNNYTINVDFDGKGPTFRNCDMGNSTYNDRNRVQIENGGTGSIFGEGSLAVIVAFVALIASVASIIVNVGEKKKKGAPVTQNKTEE